uniref:Uncharacterized protein n=1 Tax=Trichogramma kaykai TaxID=54128 RepID=A0ABD2XJY8_9HYME
MIYRAHWIKLLILGFMIGYQEATKIFGENRSPTPSEVSLIQRTEQQQKSESTIVDEPLLAQRSVDATARAARESIDDQRHTMTKNIEPNEERRERLNWPYIGLYSLPYI